MKINTTYRLQFGHGTQYFHITRVTAKGKPFGFRLNGYNPRKGGGEWRPTSLKIDDKRVRGEVELPDNAPKVPALRDKVCPYVLKAKTKQVKELKAEVGRLRPLNATNEGQRAAFEKHQDVVRTYHFLNDELVSLRNWDNLTD